MDLADLNETREWEASNIGDDCPRCEDGKVVIRINRKKFDSGENPEFLGCSNFPYCEFTENQ